MPVRGQREVAGALAAGRLVLDERQAAARRVDAERDDAVVASVRAVEEPAGRVESNLRGRARSPETRRQRGYRVEGRERAPCRIPGEGGDS